ncbi:MAG: flavin reductase family protein [Deltaproteobacteria bacterium]|nr:flavin reductase family protein [Deltaproteobacteria bacterium]
MKESIGAKPLVFPTPVWVVGTYDREGRPDVMTAAWGSICCSKPPCVSISIQKIRHTYGNLVERKAFTVNVPSERYLKEADYFGIVSGKKVDKFSAAGLTPVKSDLVDAPYVKEFPLVLECMVIHTHEIGLHTQFIGEIKDVKADKSVLDEKGLPDIEKVKPCTYAPEIRTYYGIGQYLGKAFFIGREIRENQ